MVSSERGATRAASAATVSGLDARVLALASLAAVLGSIVGHAFGGDLVATLVCAAVTPWITTFLTHPGPHRVRRVAAVLAFSALVASCRRAAAALAAAAPARRGPGGRVLASGEALAPARPRAGGPSAQERGSSRGTGCVT